MVKTEMRAERDGDRQDSVSLAAEGERVGEGERGQRGSCGEGE